MLVTTLLIKEALDPKSGNNINSNSKGNFTMFESDTLAEANKTAKIAGISAIVLAGAHVWGTAANTVQGFFGRHVGDGEEDLTPSDEA
jgi:hypothetical protein